MTANLEAAGLNLFYPIVPDVHWLERLVPLGIKVVQLRLKDASSQEIESQIARSLTLTKAHNCQLIVNDYWQQAIAAGADYIHLGQEDLAGADLPAIKQAGIRLGISTHDKSELETALAAEPDYIALGPIFETKLKVMKWHPQGLERLTTWRQRIGSLPLVAIGGLTPERIDDVIDAGANSLAVITDFFTSSDPEERVRTWQKCADSRQIDSF